MAAELFCAGLIRERFTTASSRLRISLSRRYGKHAAPAQARTKMISLKTASRYAVIARCSLQQGFQRERKRKRPWRDRRTKSSGTKIGIITPHRLLQESRLVKRIRCA